ncbi:uncharacterized protein LOC111699005 [Eurytemora carolleeae]|uniref:uncharacterized protein LOC111699005 n=1 Tax=Eurytemora carolleeae TaxID=1294199 RepID=UPI000C794A30|nr:uncharacterized protein LOC111699005 [Eurytemora carolleeae]|eukprot:XP_023325294.1 uncharacterized protein LOC111699005 [Eurytemora affinis]
MTKKEDQRRDPSTASQTKNTSVTPSSSGVGLSGVVLGAVLSITAHLIYRNYFSMADRTDAKSPEIFRGMNGLKDEYDLIIIGAGLSGAVIAEQASSRLGLKSLILEKRNHIGGNCYDYIDQHGIRISLYGVHIFHTKYPRVEEYVTKFSSWVPYQHRVLGEVKDENGTTRVVPIPPNLDTVNILFNTNLETEQDMKDWLDQRRPKLSAPPADGEEMSISRVGQDLYEKIFKPYTKKQWDKWPKELDASVLARLPVRTTKDDRYFDDLFQALPKDGYTKMFENMILNNPDITVRVNVDYFDVKDFLPKHELLVFTGPIDAFYASKGLDKLEYRSIFWETEYIEPKSGFYQDAWVVNHPDMSVGWTRISEYKHSPNQPKGTKDLPGTVIYKVLQE